MEIFRSDMTLQEKMELRKNKAVTMAELHGDGLNY